MDFILDRIVEFFAEVGSSSSSSLFSMMIDSELRSIAARDGCLNRSTCTPIVEVEATRSSLLAKLLYYSRRFIWCSSVDLGDVYYEIFLLYEEA